jgi:hypothetical protein
VKSIPARKNLSRSVMQDDDTVDPAVVQTAAEGKKGGDAAPSEG